MAAFNFEGRLPPEKPAPGCVSVTHARRRLVLLELRSCLTQVIRVGSDEVSRSPEEPVFAGCSVVFGARLVLEVVLLRASTGPALNLHEYGLTVFREAGASFTTGLRHRSRSRDFGFRSIGSDGLVDRDLRCCLGGIRLGGVLFFFVQVRGLRVIGARRCR